MAANAQRDSNDVSSQPSGHPRYITGESLVNNLDTLTPVDTALDQLTHQDPYYLSNLGNFGSVPFPLLWDLNVPSGFNFGLNQWDGYRLTFDKLPFYNTLDAYADFTFSQGLKDLQYVHGLFTQNIKPYWNYCVSFNSLKAPDAYVNQKVNHNIFAFSTWYYSPSRRYKIIAGVIANNFLQQENGGIINDSEFLAGTIFQQQRADINLADAMQLWKDRDFRVKQFLYLGPETTLKLHDSDSVAARFIIPRFYLAHDIEYYTQTYDYSGTDTGSFYKHFYNDSDFTADTFGQHSLSNIVSAGFMPPGKPGVAGSAFVKHSMIKASELSSETYSSFNLYNLSVGLGLTYTGKIDGALSYEHYLTGYNKGDNFLKANAAYRTGFKYLSTLTATAQFQSFEQAFTTNYFSGNHFRWDTHFDKSKLFSLDLYATDSSNGRVGVKLMDVDPLIVYTSGGPYQTEYSASYIRAYLEKTIGLKPLYFTFNGYVQKSNGFFTYLYFPKYVLRTSLYLEGFVFKHAMLARAGFDFNINSSYRPYSYIPELSVFGLYDSTDIKVGNYPSLDVFFSAKVKRFQGYFKIEHLNQGFSGDKYFLLPHYPYQPRSFRFGIRWIFFN